MHARLYRDIRIRNRSREEFSKGTEEESVAGCDASALREHVFKLFEDCVLQDRIYDEHQGGKNAGEEGGGAFFLEQFSYSCQGGGFPCGLLGLGRGFGKGGGGLGLSRCHAGVDDPDGVGDEDGGGAGDGAGHHGFEGCEFLGGAGGADGGAFEEGAGPFVPWGFIG